MSEVFPGARADIVWAANTGVAVAEIGEVGEVYRRTTAGMSDEALRLAISQERLNRTIARSGPESTSAKTATLAYRREVASLASEQRVAAEATSAASRATVTVREQASGNIARIRQERTALAELAAEYRRVARAAVAGSEEQVAAARLALDAERRLGYAGAGAGGVAAGRRGGRLKGEERQGERIGRGALAGLGVSGELSRALVFGSSAFLGAYGFTHAIKLASDAAKEHQVTEGQLAAALHTAGLSYAQYRGQIDETLAKQRALTGFTEEDTGRSFIRLVRTTGDVGKALKDNSLAANIARGANVSLERASQAVNRALGGQTTSLRRLYPDIPKGVSGYRALQIAQQHFAGSSEAYSKTAAGAQARLNNAIRQTEVTIGTALIPTITKLEGRSATWLSQQRNQARIQHDVNQALKIGGQTAHGLGDAYHVLAPPIRLVTRLLGGTRHTVELLALAFASMKLRALLVDLGLVSKEFRLIGASAATATPEVAGLAAAEGAAGAGGPGGLVPFGGGRGAPGSKIPLRDLRAAGKGGFLGRLLGRLAPAATDLTLGGGGFILPGLSEDSRPGAKVHTGEVITQGGKKFVIIATPDGKIAKIVTLADYQAALTAQAKPHADTGFRGVDLSAPGGAGSGARPPALDRLTRINLAVSAANLAVARGDKGAQAELLAALEREVQFDRDYEAKQLRLERTDPAHNKQHAAILQGLYSDEQSALGQIASIEDARAAKVKAAHDKAAAAAEKRRKAAAAARAKEKHEHELEVKAGEKHYRDSLKLHEQELHNATLRARLTTKTLADDRHAIAAEIAFDRAREHDRQLTKKEQENYVAKELADRKALADLNKKAAAAKAGTAVNLAALERDFLTAQAAVFAAQSNVQLPGGGAGDTNIEVHNHFPHGPTTDGSREARVAHFAIQAAFA